MHGRERISVTGKLDQHALGIAALPVEHAILELRTALGAVLHQHPWLGFSRHVDRDQAGHGVGLAAEELGATEAAQQALVVLEVALADLESVDDGAHERAPLALRQVDHHEHAVVLRARDERDQVSIG